MLIHILAKNKPRTAKKKSYVQLTRSSAVDITPGVGDSSTEQVTQLCRVLATWLVHKHVVDEAEPVQVYSR